MSERRPARASDGVRGGLTPRGRRSRRTRHGITGWLFLLPLLVCFGLFSWYPMVKGVLMSFQYTNLSDPARWVGLSNYQSVLHDRLLGKAVTNTLWFLLLSFLIGFPLPIIVAVLINELRRHKSLFAALAYLPAVIPPVVSILLWKYLYDPNPSGWLNAILGHVGLGPFGWLQTSPTVLIALVIEITWGSMGTAVIIYLAAMRGVTTELYDAADVDGAGFWAKLRAVTLPALYPIMGVNLLFQVVGMVQIFNEPYLFTGGGPRNKTVTVMLLIYRYAFLNEGNYGKAAALSVLVALFLIVVTLLSNGIQRLRGGAKR